MSLLSNEHIKLRALEPEDLVFLFETENQESLWEVSHTLVPFSKYVLKQYLEQAHLDIYETKQLRLVICDLEDTEPLGFVDLYDFDPFHKRAGVGIVILPESREKGIALEAIKLLKSYSFNHLNLHQLYASVTDDNLKSLNLFKKAGFNQTGIRKDWIYRNNNYQNEIFFQCLSTN